MTVSDNRNRLDAHGERIRAIEVRLGANNIVSSGFCASRHESLERRMEKIERKVTDGEKRQLAILVGVILTLIALAANLAVRVA